MDTIVENKGGCQHWVYPTNSWGKMNPRKCDKQAVITDTHGRQLCQHHYNKWSKKMQKHHPNFTNLQAQQPLINQK